MSKPKTKVPAPALALAPGDVTLEPIGAPNVLLSKLRIDRGSGEQTINFARYHLARAMKQKNANVNYFIRYEETKFTRQNHAL